MFRLTVQTNFSLEFFNFSCVSVSILTDKNLGFLLTQAINLDSDESKH